MTSYELSPRARAGLSEIWDYTAETWGAEQADRYVRQIAATCAISRPDASRVGTSRTFVPGI